jgi:8-oxo-dGTP pyrophosphatase MutT (NUDIX family)
MNVVQVNDLRNGKLNQQSGAICYRDLTDGQREILLITSRDSGRWVIPKGNIAKRESARDAALREAKEEAGLEGKASKKAVGLYTYLKRENSSPCLVEVFSVQVTGSASKFPEKGIRKLEWVSVDEAIRRVAEPELKGLIARLRITT